MSRQNNTPHPASTDANVKTKEMLLKQLNRTMARLIDVYQNMANPETEIYEGWTAKNILGHITFWHESFARNVSDLVNGCKPTPLKGTYADLNQRSLEEMKGLTVECIMARLSAAQQVIQQNILSPTLQLIPYRKGSRDYTPEEHLDVVNGHIMEHLKSIEKVRKGN